MSNGANNNGSKTSEKKPALAGVDPAVVKELAKILREDGLSEIEVQVGEMKLRLARPAPVAAAPVAFHHPAQAAPVAAPFVAPPPAGPDPTHPGVVVSPMVGTVYLQADETAPEFVKEGQEVEEGQTILIVEAMKTFNHIPAPRSGRVTKIYVANKQPVEFGEPLAIIE